MKTIKVSLILAAIIIFPGIMVLADPGIPDTVRIDSVSGMAGGNIVLPVYFYNDETISAVELVFDFDNNNLQIDSCSLEGSRITGYTNIDTAFSDSANLLSLFLYTFPEFIGPGNGLLCNLYFTLSGSAGNQTFPITNGSWPFGQNEIRTTRFADSAASSFIFPEFVDGKIHVVEPPPSPDSVWVQRITGAPGNTVAVDIYGYNVESLSLIALALEYSSDDIVYNDTSFVGTRGISAVTKSIDLRSQLRQILITLAFDEVNPLEPGSGPLATILFNIEPSAPDEMVIIDSTLFLGSQPLEFTLTTGEGGGKFTPYFTYGYVDIKTSTDVEQRYDPLIPDDYALEQNVPNPFNPTTHIQFDLPRQSHVRLDVINVLGRHVKTLVEKSLPAGVYTVTFDGKDDNEQSLASGVYFYRLEAEGFLQSKKMILLK